MSRFVQILENHEYEITVSTFQRMLREMVDLLEACSGHIEMTFPYFVRKAAPVSGVTSLMDYDVTLIGAIRDGDVRLSTRVVVPVTSLCPCSKAISAYGAHNQRSHVTVLAHTRALVWIEELIDTVEHESSCQLFGLLKRPDEKFVTEYAYDNPKFVEDLVRDIARRLDATLASRGTRSRRRTSSRSTTTRHTRASTVRLIPPADSLFLCSLPQGVELRRGALLEAPSVAGEALHLSKPPLEPLVGPGEGPVAAHSEAAGEVDAREEEVSELGLDPLRPLLPRERFPELGNLLVELGEHPFDLRPVESDRGRPALELRGPREGR